jgi:hypothetical protein
MLLAKSPKPKSFGGQEHATPLARAEVIDQAATRNRMSKAIGPARWLTVAPTERS